jgi:hypothetical protein
MFPKYRHTPIVDPERKRCSVCHQAVYSLVDIHPQCAIKRAVALESRSKRVTASKAGCEEGDEGPVGPRAETTALSSRCRRAGEG